MTLALRPIAAPFVVAPPAGARVRTRLQMGDADVAVAQAVGAHLGSLAGGDLALRCRQGRLDAKAKAVSRTARKQALTVQSSSRWAGALTRTSEDAWGLAERNLAAEARSLRARIGRVAARVSLPVGERRGRARGYASQNERWEKQRRLQVLKARLVEVDERLRSGRMSICRGGRRLARTRPNLDAGGLGETGWRQRWDSARWFITADGEAGKNLGNETIRWHPDEGWVELKLPGPLAHLANHPHGRYRLSAPVTFPYRGDEVAAQASSGALRYDITCDPAKGRWYLDASWTFPEGEPPSLGELRQHRVVAVDLNADHLAAWVLDASANPVAAPVTVPLDLARLAASTRDGRLRAAIREIIALAKSSSAAAVVIEDLDFDRARTEGREHTGRRPIRGRKGRNFRRLVAGIPTAKFRDRLVQMAATAGLAVIAVDPAYTSRWAAQHWLQPLQNNFSPTVTGHHAAAVVIGRRGLGQRARRRERCDSTRPEDRQQRATDSAVRPTPAPAGLAEQRTRKPGDRKAPGQPHPVQKTRPAERASPGDQGSEDRSRRPEVAMSYSLPR